MNIPVAHASLGERREKLSTVQIPSIDFHPVRLYSIVDMGHQFTNFNKWTHQYRFTFELLDLRQQFYEDDPEIKPTVIGEVFTFSMNKNSNLRPFISASLGKTLNDAEAADFNVFSLLDKYFVASVTHSEPNSEGKIYANVDRITPFNKRMFPEDVDFTPYNEVHCFHIGTHGFDSDEFANCPGFLRRMIMESEEGVAHKNAGGIFREPVRTDGGSTAVAPPQQRQNPSGPPQQQASNKKPVLVMIDKQYTLEQWHTAKWTDQALVDAGKARWETPLPQQAPAGPPAPSSNAPGPSGPMQMQQAPVNNQGAMFQSPSDDDGGDIPY